MQLENICNTKTNENFYLLGGYFGGKFEKMKSDTLYSVHVYGLITKHEVKMVGFWTSFF